MDKKINWIILFSLVICLYAPCSVFANNGGSAIGGVSPGDGPLCSTCEWVYAPGGKGIRLTLYKFDGSNLSVIGSRDYCSGSSCDSSLACAFQTSQKSGKVAYQEKYGWPNFNDCESINRNASQRFSDSLTYANQNGNMTTQLATEVEEMFFLKSNNEGTILDKIKYWFYPSANNINKSDLGNIYITLEPTFYITDKNNGYRYYGTIYELVSLFRAGNAMNGLNEWIFYKMPRSVLTLWQTANDKKMFVGNYVTLVSGNELSDAPWDNFRRSANAKEITGRSGFGINVFWLGNYVPNAPSCTISESGNIYTLTVHNNDGFYYDIGANKDALKNNVTNNSYQASFKDQLITGKVYNSSGLKVASCDLERKIPTCKETCSSNDLGCMEDYCQVMSSSSKEKRNCITTCGYSDPGFSGCGEKNDANGRNTECDVSTNATLKTCTKATTSTYYKSTCTETSTIKYGNSLPVTVLPGTGFSYTPTVSGSKYCRNTFETKKWEFDYAASYTKAERDVLKGILNNYNSTTSATWTADRFKYSSSKGTNIEIEITNDNDLSAKNRTTTKKLVTAQKDIDNKYEVSTEDNAPIVTMYENSNKTSRNVVRAVLTNSSNRSTYQLPAVCISVGSGDIYEPTNNKCKSSSEGPYYDYYTNLKIKKDTYATITRVTKAGTALDVQNTCGYRVDLPVSCAIVEKNGIYELRIENKNNVENLRYGLSLSNNDFNGQTTYRGDITNKTLYGVVAIRDDRDDVVVATCKLEKSNVPNPTPTCNDLKSTQYDEIKKYCTTSWMNDKQGFASEKDCINYCGAGSNTCKNNPEVNNKDVNSVINFCKDPNNREAMGYDKITYASDNENDEYNKAMCINDCLDLPKSNECLGIACDYIYRPISLNDPFPNKRRSGYNWYGKEIYITEDLLNPVLNPNGAEPEYVITLNKEKIDAINKNTDTYNSSKGKNAYLDYVYMDETNKNGAYVSKFIHQKDEGKGGYYNYFTGGTLLNK